MSYKAEPQAEPRVPKEESEKELFQRWNIPDMTDHPVHEQDVALNIAAPETEIQTRVEDENEAPALTAEALEAIRQAAYEEGFEQGRQEGMEQGHKEGLESGQKEGRTQGLEEGRQEGLAQGAAEIEERAASLDALMKALYQPQQQINQQVEQQLVELTSQLAQAVTHHELKTNRDIILSTLKEAVDLLPFQQQRVRVQLNPSDLELVQELYSDEQIKQRGWFLEAEPALPIGDLRLLTEQSDVSIQMEERLQRVTQLFLSQLNHSRQEHSQQAHSAQPQQGSAPQTAEKIEPAGGSGEPLSE